VLFLLPNCRLTMDALQCLDASHNLPSHLSVDVPLIDGIVLGFDVSDGSSLHAGRDSSCSSGLYFNGCLTALEAGTNSDDASISLALVTDYQSLADNISTSPCE
jgi:hypothetical protein